MAAEIERLAALKADTSFDFWRNDDPKCPHCGQDYPIYENEAWHLYDDQRDHEVECNFCELPFKVITNVAYTFSTDEQDDEE